MESIPYIFILILSLLRGDEPAESKVVSLNAIHESSIIFQWKQADGNS